MFNMSGSHWKKLNRTSQIYITSVYGCVFVRYSDNTNDTNNKITAFSISSSDYCISTF